MVRPGVFSPFSVRPVNSLASLMVNPDRGSTAWSSADADDADRGDVVTEESDLLFERAVSVVVLLETCVRLRTHFVSLRRQNLILDELQGLRDSGRLSTAAQAAVADVSAAAEDASRTMRVVYGQNVQRPQVRLGVPLRSAFGT